ncbi:MAG: hypothetical protein KY392_02760 [Chloroflexi bacterium]|nr:hypothetical protein [Chloroflexota bacterium]
MRSPLGPILVLLGLATTLVVVLLLVQVMGLRGDLVRAEERLVTLQAEVEAQDPGVTATELRRELDELRTWTRDWMIATQPGPGGGSVGTPAGSGGRGDDDEGNAVILRRIDQVLLRIDALDARIDEICEGVPVC